MTIRFGFLALLVALLGAGCGDRPSWRRSSPDSPVHAQVVETADGLVQIAGLVHRSPEELELLIQGKSPGTNLSSGACAGVLKYELGFPDAAVIRYSTMMPGGPDSLQESPITLLLLVEPEDAERVRYLPAPPDSIGPVPEWAEQYDLYPMGRLSSAIGEHVGLPSRKPATLPDGVPDTIRVLTDLGVAFLETHDREGDRQRALEVIRTDRDWINRSIAAAILTSFPEEDSTWWALARVIRGIGPGDFGRHEAIVAIQSLGVTHPRPVDWTPAAENLQAILEGTNLFAVGPLMQTLTTTKISPELAPEVIGDGRFVLAYLRSPNRSVRSQALLFLRQISGEDFGDDVDRWEEWVAALS
jgi:hypothetical protein